MKRLFFLIPFISLNLNAQTENVGINTEFPQEVFHIDGKTDNPKTPTLPNSEQVNNDFMVDEAGNIGLGTIPNADAKVNISVNTNNDAEIGKGFRLKDGTEGDGNLLSLSNTQGDIVWKKRIATVRGNLGPGFNGSVLSDMAFTSTTITLPPGKWLIRSSILLRVGGINGTYSDGLFAQLSWADKNSDGSYSLTPDAISGNLFGGAYLGVYSLAFGQTIINNATTTNKTYYLVTRASKTWGTLLLDKNWSNLAAGSWGENAIIAFAAN